MFTEAFLPGTMTTRDVLILPYLLLKLEVPTLMLITKTCFINSWYPVCIYKVIKLLLTGLQNPDCVNQKEKL